MVLSLVLDELAPRRRRPLEERDGDALEGNQGEDRLEARRVEVLLEAPPKILVLPLAKYEGRKVPVRLRANSWSSGDASSADSNSRTRERGRGDAT